MVSDEDLKKCKTIPVLTYREKKKKEKENNTKLCFILYSNYPNLIIVVLLSYQFPYDSYIII